MANDQMNVSTIARPILDRLRSVVIGKDQTLRWVLAAILAGGHILLEDLPGVGKTTMAVAFSKVTGLDCRRLQFTPDVLPSDVTGYYTYEQHTGKMVYRPGAILCDLFLADELNRATSRTQSALLEAMEEGQVTVDGVSHPIPGPFTVIATQNPFGAAGTQRLPDSQTDRFMIRLRMGYPDAISEAAMLSQRQDGDPMDALRPILTREDVMKLRSVVAGTFIKGNVIDYIVALVRATREHDDILQGASPRATLAIAAMAKAVARLEGRDFVTPKDVRSVYVPTVAHRIHLKPAAQTTPEQVLQDILSATKAPSID